MGLRFTSGPLRNLNGGVSARPMRALGGLGDIGDVYDPTTASIRRAVLLQLAKTWGEIGSRVERATWEAGIALDRLLDRGLATYAMITEYNRSAIAVYRTSGSAWQQLRLALRTDDMKPPRPPPLFGSQVRTGGPGQAFTLYVDVPQNLTAIKRFDLPPQVAFRTNQTFNGAYVAGSGKELKAVHMANALSGLGIAPAAIPAATLVGALIASAVAAVVLSYLIDAALTKFFGSDAAKEIANAWEREHKNCNAERIRQLDKCIEAGGDPGVCQQRVTALIHCPDTPIAPDPPGTALVKTLAKGAVLIGGIWFGAKWLSQRRGGGSKG